MNAPVRNRRAFLAENRRARFDYDIIETYEAGIELTGQEVKSAKAGHINLSGSYAVVRNNEVWLLNAQIPAYQPKNAPKDYDSGRTRRLLLRHEEIKGITGRVREKGLTFVPLRAYIKRGFVKIELGLGKSRKKSDKRAVLKKRAAEREMRTAREKS
ncbi:MAG: SsrA-binding protein [Parcubacteria group bacterium GW2011_GWB1_56_8]|nr:MAG: SsrA-binding protein [Parcubacteria group bacterium GW2011_GWB1_56_8]